MSSEHSRLRVPLTATPPTPQQRRRAADVICAHYADNPAEARETLAMLDLLDVGAGT